ncbi:MAG: undecaprenyl-diphosphatase, partial [Patiriisocius sp.]
MFTTLKNWDQELFVWLNNLGLEQYDTFWVFATQIESWTALFLYFSVIVLYYHKGKKGVIMLLGIILTFIITFTLTDLTKNYVARIRPNNTTELSGLIRILQKPTSYSFFSGHASSSFSIVTFMVLSIRSFNSWIYLAYLWPLIFVMSRIYVGVHYPS